MFTRRLGDLLFGKPEHKVFRDDRLGELKTVVRRVKPGNWCLWEGRHLLDGQTQETWFALSGDSTQPYAGLLAAVYRVLDGRSSIRNLATIELERRTKSGSIEDFYLSDIADWDQHDEILQIELAPMDQPILESDIRFDWPSDGRSHLVVVRAAQPIRIAQGQQIARGLA